MTALLEQRAKATGAPLSPTLGMLQRKCACGSHTPGGVSCKACAGNMRLQRKLTIGSANDPLEQEADRVAEGVLAGPTSASVNHIRPAIQRAPSTPTLEYDDVPESVHRVIGRSGRPLDAPVRQDMERRFGHDFSQVRIHQDDESADAARAVHARAFTVGNHIALGATQPSIATASGKRLLAHELTHVVQQDKAPSQLVQRDLAIEPTVPNASPAPLTGPALSRAIAFNSVFFRDAAEIAILRDVLGVQPQPAAIDAEFVNALVRYQANFGIVPDGKLGPATCERLEREITAESDFLSEAPTDTPLRRVARRLHLRAMVSRTRGIATHQGFVGSDTNPEGSVTARTGDSLGAGANEISLEYTGENSNAVNWLQFINMQMFATPPGAAVVFNAGTVGTTGGPVNWSNAATTNWFVDAVPGGSPFYNVSGGLNTRAAARRLAIFDEPGGPTGLPVAQAFTAAGSPAAGANTVTMRMGFASYVVRANQARYRVNWTATTTYNITAATSSAIAYAQGSASPVSRLAAVHRAALIAEYPGNPVN